MFSFLKSKQKPQISNPIVNDDAYNIIQNNNHGTYYDLKPTQQQQKRKLHESPSPSLSSSLTSIKKKSFHLQRKGHANTKRSKKQTSFQVSPRVINKSSIGLPQTLSSLDNQETQNQLKKVFRSPSRLDLMPLTPTSNIQSPALVGFDQSEVFNDTSHNLLDESNLEPFKNPFTDFANRFNLSDIKRNSQDDNNLNIESTILSVDPELSNGDPKSATSAIDSFAHNLNNRISKDLRMDIASTSSASPLKYNGESQLQIKDSTISAAANELLSTYTKRTLDPLINVKRQTHISLSSDEQQAQGHATGLLDLHSQPLKNYKFQQERTNFSSSSLYFDLQHKSSLSTTTNTDSLKNTKLNSITSKSILDNLEPQPSPLGQKSHSKKRFDNSNTGLNHDKKHYSFQNSTDFDNFLEQSFELHNDDNLFLESDNFGKLLSLEDEKKSKKEKFELKYNEIRELNNRLISSTKSSN